MFFFKYSTLFYPNYRSDVLLWFEHDNNTFGFEIKIGNNTFCSRNESLKNVYRTIDVYLDFKIFDFHSSLCYIFRNKSGIIYLIVLNHFCSEIYFNLMFNN